MYIICKKIRIFAKSNAEITQRYTKTLEHQGLQKTPICFE